MNATWAFQCAAESMQNLCQMIRIILKTAVLDDGWVLADSSTLQRTRMNATGTYTERMITIGMPVGVFDAKAMKELLLLKQEFTSFMEWDASFAYTPSDLPEHKTLCSAQVKNTCTNCKKCARRSFVKFVRLHGLVLLFYLLQNSVEKTLHTSLSK